MVESTGDVRLMALTAWLEQQTHGMRHLRPASGDASFRRYFRLDTDEGSRIAMDAPPDRESVTPFVNIAATLSQAGVPVPRIHAVDHQQGFVLLDDLGQQHYLDVINRHNADVLYGNALEILRRIQSSDSTHLQVYDDTKLRQELMLFPEWLMDRHLGLELDHTHQAMLSTLNDQLVANALAQPRVFVHRDYHARNLMLTGLSPAVLDFQDAVRGPLTYDVVSLLRDAYVAWPEERVTGWALTYRDRAVTTGLCPPVDDAQFMRWFDLMGLQRHLKVLGIFARLYHRDGKPGYLGDIPRVLHYVETVAPRYAESRPLAEFIASARLRQRIEAAGIVPCAP